MKLTTKQQSALNTLDKDTLVSAGAGTGKTRVLTERFVKILTHLKDSGQSPERAITQILTITFTEKAAQEMKERISNLLEENGLEEERQQLEKAYISTIHAFCARFLRENSIEALVDPEFNVLDEDSAFTLANQALENTLENIYEKDKYSLLQLTDIFGEEILREGTINVYNKIRSQGILPENIHIRTDLSKEFLELENIISQHIHLLPSKSLHQIDQLIQEAKNINLNKNPKNKEQIFILRNILPVYKSLLNEKYLLPHLPFLKDYLISFHEEYERLKQAYGSLDFEDLEIKTKFLLETNSSIRKEYQNRFKFLMVDEFQDVNPLQYKIINLLHNKNNLFVVGDKKQSIFYFRDTDVNLFINSEKEIEKNGHFINLDENFRSYPDIISFNNRFFEALWQEEPSFFDELLPMGDFNPKSEPAVNIISIPYEKKIEEGRIEEAKTIASTINRLYEEQNVQYKDIAILLRSRTDMHIYEKALKDAGLPYFVITGKSFYEQQEIQDIYQALRILDNPFNDIALYATLRSPFALIDEDTLFILGKHKKSKPLYLTLKKYGDLDITPEQKERIRIFLDNFTILTTQKDQLGIYSILNDMIESNHFSLRILASEDGKRKLANIKKILEEARSFEQNNFTLTDFINFLATRIEQKTRENEARIEAEKGEVIKIMTIHSAKGLEWPVVFVADLGRQLRPPAKSPPILYSQEYGLTSKFQSPINNQQENTFSYDQTKETIQNKTKAELNRLLYVALTRARDLVFLCGSFKEKKSKSDPTTWMEHLNSIFEINKEQSSIDTNNISVSIIRESTTNTNIQKYKSTDIFSTELKDLIPISQQKIDRLKESFTNIKQGSTETILLDNNSDFQQKLLQPKFLTPSQIMTYNYCPEALQHNIEYKSEEESLNWGKNPGNAVHKILEKMDFSSSIEEQKKSLLYLLDIYSKNFSNNIRQEIENLANNFINSSLADQLKNAQAVQKELYFSLKINNIPINGIIDCIFKENNKWIILDYKTNNIRKEDIDLTIKKHGYDLQAMLYAKALKEIGSLELDKVIIYFLKPNIIKEIKIDNKEFSELDKKVEDIYSNISNLKFAVKDPMLCTECLYKNSGCQKTIQTSQMKLWDTKVPL